MCVYTYVHFDDQGKAGLHITLKLLTVGLVDIGQDLCVCVCVYIDRDQYQLISFSQYLSMNK
jgi:hypothetical protein